MEKPTLKEYKAMMEGTTDAPWVVPLYNEVISESDNKRVAICSGVRADYKIRNNAQFIAASRNIAPELIRVIELAEEAILTAMEVGLNAFCEEDSVKAWDKAQQSLFEIRKIKGE